MDYFENLEISSFRIPSLLGCEADFSDCSDLEGRGVCIGEPASCVPTKDFVVTWAKAEPYLG